MAFKSYNEQFLEELANAQAAVAAGIEVKEFDLPFLKIPNGWPADDKVRIVLSKDNEPTEAALHEFFTSEVMSQRLILCPEINRDMTDDWGIFGFEPGFIFVCSLAHEGEHCFNDFFWKTNQSLSWDPVTKLPILPHYDCFPRRKFHSQEITQERTPRTFAFLFQLLKQPPCLR